MLKVFNKVWVQREYPRKWRVGLIKPITKEENRDSLKNYSELILIDTLYKI